MSASGRASFNVFCFTSSRGMAWRVAHRRFRQRCCSTGCEGPIHRCGSAPGSHFVALSFECKCFWFLQTRSIEAEHECCFEAALPGRGMASSKGCSRDCPLWLAAFASIQEGCWNFSFATPATISDPSQNSYVVPHIQVFGGSACNLTQFFCFSSGYLHAPAIHLA